jgi:hypothetical protein
VVERAAGSSESGWGVYFAHQGDSDLRHLVHVWRLRRSRCGLSRC